MSDARKTVFLVDDDVTNLTIGHNILSSMYNTVTINSGARLMKMLERLTPDLILLDVDMPAMSGFDTIRKLKKDAALKHIPVVFLTARNDSDSELVGLSYGAVDYIVKPFSPPILLKRIEVQLLLEKQRKELVAFNTSLKEMVDKRTETVVSLQNTILQVIAEISDLRGASLSHQITRTRNFLGILVDAVLKSSEYGEVARGWDVDTLLESSQLHDVGKLGIRESLLVKEANLTGDEFEEVKMHTVISETILERAKKDANTQHFFDMAKILATTHHEKWDGTGYPKGLKGEEIPFESRLMAIADVYDSLVKEKPYRAAYTHEEAVNIIKDESGRHFDPALVKLFLAHADRFKDVT